MTDNRTSQAVDDVIAWFQDNTNDKIGSSVFSIAAKYKQMEEALQALKDEYKCHGHSYLKGRLKDIVEPALIFDPLA